MTLVTNVFGECLKTVLQRLRKCLPGQSSKSKISNRGRAELITYIDMFE